MTGDQTRMENLKDLSPLSSSENLILIPFDPKSWGQNLKGGFWDRPFGNDDGWWSVKGKNKSWECGDSLNGLDGNRYESLHNIYFRGESPSKENLVKRYLEKIKN